MSEPKFFFYVFQASKVPRQPLKGRHLEKCEKNSKSLHLNNYIWLCIYVLMYWPYVLSAKSRCLSCTDIEERVTQLDPRHLDIVTACLNESWLHAVQCTPYTLLLYIHIHIHTYTIIHTLYIHRHILYVCPPQYLQNPSPPPPHGSDRPSLLGGGNLQTDAAQLYLFVPIPAKEKKLGLLSIYKFSLAV